MSGSIAHRVVGVVNTHHEKPRSKCVPVTTFLSFWATAAQQKGVPQMGLTLLRYGGFLTWHNTWLRELQLWCKDVLSKDRFLPSMAVSEM